MLARNGTYFDPELCIDGHYIVTGKTNDMFCGDDLVICDILPMLHAYLRHTERFDAVFFFDTSNMLFCFDQQSLSVLTSSPEEQGAPTAPSPVSSGSISAKGPLGRRRRRARAQADAEQPAAAARAASETQPAEVPAPTHPTTPLNLGRMSIHAAWQQVLAVLRHTTRRCALVISNASQMEGPQEGLLELPSFAVENHSVVLYVFREDSLENAERWTDFARNVVLPKMSSRNAQENRVITIGCPNELEIRNLLNAMRLDRENPLRVRAGELERVAELLAASCARNNLGVSGLMGRLRSYARLNPQAELSLETWQDFCDEPGYRTAFQTLDALVGQDGLKRQLHERRTYFMAQGAHRARPRGASRLLPPAPVSSGLSGLSLNVVLKGAPGTGKSTIARVIGRLYYELGLLPSGHLVECSAANLVSPHVGETAGTVRAQVQRAMGGVLFIDEAYALLSNAHGREAIDQLTNDMTAYQGQFAVVIAGYSRQIDDLLDANPGLESRFATTYELENYTPAEMRDIFLGNVERDGFLIDDALRERLDDFFEAWVNGAGRNWGNAREARTLLDAMKTRASTRVVNEGRLGMSQDDMRRALRTLTPADIPEPYQHCLARRSNNLQEALERIDGMIGLHNVKAFLRSLARNISMGAFDGTPGNYLFIGAPGTGKTTVARQMGELLGLLGVLRRRVNNVRECRAADLLNGSIDLNEAVDEARGGVFFLDEAHQLATSDRGREIIRALVPLIEDPHIHADTCFICAGYTVEMRAFLEADSGLERRFPKQNRLRFNDYTAPELARILQEMAVARGQQPTQAYLDRSQLALEAYLENRPSNFGNGGFIRDTFLPDSISARSRRLSELITGTPDGVPTDEQIANIPDDVRRQLAELGEYDLPPAFDRLAGPHGRRPSEQRGALERVEALIGKDEIVEFARSRVSGDDANMFFDAETPAGLNFAIVGPPGCGRHTAARALAALWREAGLLERDDVVFANQGSLVGQYVGSTPAKTRAVVERALGSTLVVEGPSSLLPARSREDTSYGPEALREIAAAMSGHQDDLSVVLIDSTEGLDALFEYMPGLRGQMGRVFELEDFTPEQMLRIFDEKTRDSMDFSDVGEEMLRDFFFNWVSDRGGLGSASQSWGNGMEVDRLIEELKTAWKNADEQIAVERRGGTDAERRDDAPDDVEDDGYEVRRRRIAPEHFPKKLQRYLRRTSAIENEAMAQLNALPGLASVKRSIAAIERRIRWTGGATVKPGCYLYLGNPGVGKTTVARLMGGVLKAAGVLSQGHVVERGATQMSQSPDEFDAALKLARGGILFIDEAHQLASMGPLGQEAIKRLLKALEDDDVTDTTSIILAGYPDPMRFLLSRDDGLQSRFGSEDCLVHFEDYTAQELLEVMDYMAQRAHTISAIGSSRPLSLSEGFRTRSLAVFEGVLARGDRTFGNARFVRTYLHDALNAQFARLDALHDGPEHATERELSTLEEEDIPARYRPLAQRSERGRARVRRSMLDTSLRDGAGAAGGESYEELCARLSEAAVLIEGLSPEGERISTASGSVITSDGIVLTCAHVANKAERFRVRLWCPGAVGGDVRWVEAERLEPMLDLGDMALLKMRGKNFNALSLRAPENPAAVGERILIVGYPLGDSLSQGNAETLRPSNTSGRISSIQAIAENVERCYIDCTALHGNSGSPVFSLEDGRLVGVFSGSIIPDREHSLDELNYFYPVSLFWRHFVEDDAADEETRGRSLS